MTEEAQALTGSSATLQLVAGLRSRVRGDRQAHWLPLTVFGLATLGSLGFYAVGSRPTSEYAFGTKWMNLFRALDGPQGSSPWLGIYWAGAIVAGVAATILYYRRRSSRVGLESRAAPVVFTCVGLLVSLVLIALLASTDVFGVDSRANYLVGALVLGVPAIPLVAILVGRRRPPIDARPPGVVSSLAIATALVATVMLLGVALANLDWVSGTTVLFVSAAGLAALAVFERSRPFGVFVAGLFVIALRATFGEHDQPLAPSLLNGVTLWLVVLPGAYLLLGGIGFRIAALLRAPPPGRP